jgi:hypothetical protein
MMMHPPEPEVMLGLLRLPQLFLSGLQLLQSHKLGASGYT